MELEDFVKWLEVKASKYRSQQVKQSGGWDVCITHLIDEFKKEWLSERGNE
jgi:hypothetical protein